MQATEVQPRTRRTPTLIPPIPQHLIETRFYRSIQQRPHLLPHEIENVYPREYSPVAEYGGWGIRYGKSGSAYNMRGNRGIQLELKNGKEFLIGTQQPEPFMQAVRSVSKEISEFKK